MTIESMAFHGQLVSEKEQYDHITRETKKLLKDLTRKNTEQVPYNLFPSNSILFFEHWENGSIGRIIYRNRIQPLLDQFLWFAIPEVNKEAKRLELCAISTRKLSDGSESIEREDLSELLLSPLIKNQLEVPVSELISFLGISPEEGLGEADSFTVSRVERIIAKPKSNDRRGLLSHVDPLSALRRAGRIFTKPRPGLALAPVPVPVYRTNYEEK